MFQVWVITSGDERWASNGVKYATLEQAEQAGQRLFDRWFAVERWAVVHTDAQFTGLLDPQVIVNNAVGGVRP